MNSPTEEFVLRSEAMRIIRAGQPFNMEFVEADRRRGTGGELVSVLKWMIVHKGMSDSEVSEAVLSRKTVRRKDPAHWMHKTFNIFNPADRKQHAVKVHYRLILSLNGKKVING